ncbi:hypothetical protein G3I60_20110 [Streptomyces sp. SID13666]|uniref:hypothetical protein n=1 Tax=Streptomyces sp. SID13666 TaxID=2706054 RepID=UPI0013C0E3C9|nr:hypothetical protein [Streptomyces sp. SID13666]NEA56386.1 hypothetical protein [Streptomyces sp. SID13666]
MTIVMMAGLNIATASSAQAAEAHCGWPRCTLYLNKEETRKYGYDGLVPMNLPSGPWMGVLYASNMGLRWFAIQYANRGMCVLYNVSVIPWENQGLMGYRC